MATKHQVAAKQAYKLIQFWGVWGVSCVFVCDTDSH